MFIDLAGAFGNIEHEVVMKELKQIGTPDVYCDIIKDAYTKSQFKVSCKDGATKTL